MNVKGNELSLAEEKALINTIKGNNVGDANCAWVELYKDIEAHIYKRVKDDVRSITHPGLDKRMRFAGWIGFVETIKEYKSNKAQLYSRIAKNTEFQMDKCYDREPSVLHIVGYKSKLVIPSVVWMARMDTENNQYVVPGPKNYHLMKKCNYEEKGKYNEERLALQIIEVLRKFTDENHKLSSDDMFYFLEAYRITKHGNSSRCGSYNAFLKTVAEILYELGPNGYSMTDKEGYISNVLMKSNDPQKVESAPSFEDISYVHPLDNKSLDQIIQIVFYSSVLSESKKNELVTKLLSTASVYYENPFFIRAEHKFVSGSRNSTDEQSNIADNITTIQNAINLLAQISFKYKRYNDNKELVTDSELMVSPYCLIAYQGFYYLVCAKENEEQISHLRVDLMSDVEIESYADGIPVPIDIVPFEGLPLFNPDWNSNDYSAEHLYMSSETPAEIRIKVSSQDATIYTLFHDWFGNHFEVVKASDEIDSVTILVKTSPSMIVSFAMQYPDRIEVLNEEIREEIKNKANELYRKYE